MPFLGPLIGTITASLTASLSGFFASLGFGAAAAGALANAVIQFGASLLLNAAAAALQGRNQPSAQDIARQLSQPSTEPTYRFVYGKCNATGTPVGTPVQGEVIWGCWLLNSRPSYLDTFTLFLDKREVTLTGDAFDFDGDGAVADADPFGGYVTCWISRGDQTTPPVKFTDDAPYEEGVRDDLWKTTDGWQGRTVIWLRLVAGPNGTRQERWPATPPLVEVFGKWSMVYDPRNPAQDPDDPDTWEFEQNLALCVRDALRQNPIRAYREDQLHGSFEDGADICWETVTRKDASTEKRYRAAGTLTFSDGEIEDQINPMLVSGAADLIRIGGQLGFAAGAYRAPAMTLDYLLGDSFEFTDMLPGDALVNQLRISYLSAERGYETADLQPWNIPGALAADGGVPAVKSLDLKFCPSPTQAMRVRKILGLRLRRQESISGGELPPEAFDLVGGATVTLALPEPYDALDGIYEVQSIFPGADPLGESGQLALRMPATLIKHDPAIYDYDPAVDEEDVLNEPFDEVRQGMQPPGAISITTGEAVNQDTGGGILPRIRFAADPSPSASVTGYEWEYRQVGTGIYQTGGQIGADVRDGSDKVFGFLIANPALSFDIRLRAVGASGQSDWVEYTGAQSSVTIALDLPTDGQATGGAGEIGVSFRMPNDADVRQMEIFASDTDDDGAAAILGDPIVASANTVVSVTETGLGASQTRYYFARSRGDFNTASAFTASVSATTDS